MLLRWAPGSERLLLETGDETVSHTGSKGGIRISPVGADVVVPQDERQWLLDAGIDWGAGSE
jgi:hypothetical protein